MAEHVSNDLIYEVLKAVQDRLGGIEDRLERLGRRIGSIEDYMVRLIQNDLKREREFGSLEARVSRIERRLELNDGNA